jgi:hypothetical protein
VGDRLAGLERGLARFGVFQFQNMSAHDEVNLGRGSLAYNPLT